MLDLILRTGKEFGISILLSSHLMADVERTCDRIIVLDDGHVLQEGAVSEFTEETQSVFIEVDENEGALVAALARRGIEAKLDGRSVVVDQGKPEEYDDIRDALVEADAPLRRLAPRRHHLTEIFRGESE